MSWPALPGTAWLAAFYLGALGFVAAASLATPDPVGRPIYGWDLSNFEQVFQPLFVPVVLKTFAYAAGTAVLCSLLGYPVAYTIARFGGRHKTALLLLVLVPWFTDYLIRIYAWVQVLGNEGILNSLFGVALIGNPAALLLGLTYNFLPFMIVAVYVAVERLDLRLIEASQDLYANRAATFIHVTLPNTASGIGAGALLVFLLALGDFATAQFLGGGEYMLGNLIRDQFSTAGSLPFGAALAVTLLTGLLVIGVAGYAASRRVSGSRRFRSTGRT